MTSIKTTAAKSLAALALAMSLLFSLGAAALAASSIGADEAREIAYADAGVTGSQVTSMDAQVRYRNNGTDFHKLVFRTATAKYVYRINAATGAIVQNTVAQFQNAGSGHHYESGHRYESGHHTGNSHHGGANVSITREGALQTALDHLSLSHSSLKKYEIELEYGDNCYEVELKTNDGCKYELKVNASTGAVLGGTGSVDITAEEALQIAMDHAGVSASSLKEKEVQLKVKRSSSIYEVELELRGGAEYEYEIDASTGEILDFEYDD